MEEKPSILIIEDNEEVRENLEEVLALYGYDVTAAPDGIEGVKQALAILPDLILCDVMMPGLDGFGVINILSKNEQTATTPFIFLTAKSEKQDIRHGMNLGADDYITKPFYKDELLQVIETRLNKARQVRASAGQDSIGSQLHSAERGFEALRSAFKAEDRSSEYAKRSTIVKEGEYARFIYLVKEGHVHLRRSHEYGKEYILRDVVAEDYFGIAVLLEKEPYPYTAQAAGDGVRVGKLPADRFLELINHDPNVAAAVMHHLAGYIIEGSEQLVNQAYDTVRRRTALILCELYEKHGGKPIVIQREDLAQMVGSTKESVIRSLSDFKDADLVAIKGSKIEILHPDKLRNLMV